MQNGFITNYADYPDYADIQYYMKNNSISDYANSDDFEYQVRLITDYADYADFRDYST